MFKEYYLFGKRNLHIILSLILVITIASVFFYQKSNSGTTYTSNIFINIGAQGTPLIGQQTQVFSTDSFQAIQAADNFAESVQGWFKDYDFTDQINKKAGIGVGINAKKQEKQNITLSFQVPTTEKATEVSNIIKQQLADQIKQYNQINHSSYQLTFFSANISENKSQLPLMAAVFFLVSVFIAIIAAYIIEKIRGVVSFTNELKPVYQDNLYYQKASKVKLSDINFIDTICHRTPHHKPLFVLVNPKNTGLFEKMNQQLLIQIPEDWGKLKTVENSVIIAFITLGKTSMENLNNLTAFQTNPQYTIVIY